MALTRDFNDTVAARLKSDAAFARAMFEEAITLFVNGEPEPAKSILRDLLNATEGFGGGWPVVAATSSLDRHIC